MIKKEEFSTDNPHFQSVYQFLSEEGKADLDRLEEIEKRVKMCFEPIGKGSCRKMSIFAYVYSQYVAMNESEINPDIATNISLLQYDLMVLESLID